MLTKWFRVARFFAFCVSLARFGCMSSALRATSRAKIAFQNLRFNRAFRAENRTAKMGNL
eukprot:8043744-Lingulodinium_polyedra.AAC.1